MSQPIRRPALLLCCMDYRYIHAVLGFVERQLGIKVYNVKTDAGGTKALLNGDPSVRAWILSNVKLAYHRKAIGPWARQRVVGSRIAPRKRRSTPSNWRWRRRC